MSGPCALDILSGTTESSIVYAATVRHVDALDALLRAEGISATAYHGRQRARDRVDAQGASMTGAVPIIIATNAFGMGIDKPDIRTIVHYDLPASLDVYYQESGRAGRDGESADCILLFQRRDRGLQRFFMAGPVSDARRFHHVDRRPSEPVSAQPASREVCSRLRKAWRPMNNASSETRPSWNRW